MGDKFGGFPRIDEVPTGLLLPAPYGVQRGRSVEHSIEFRRFELAGVVLELRLYGKARGVGPARNRNANRMCRSEREPSVISSRASTNPSKALQAATAS